MLLNGKSLVEKKNVCADERRIFLSQHIDNLRHIISLAQKNIDATAEIAFFTSDIHAGVQ